MAIRRFGSSFILSLLAVALLSRYSVAQITPVIGMSCSVFTFTTLQCGHCQQIMTGTDSAGNLYLQCSTCDSGYGSTDTWFNVNDMGSGFNIGDNSCYNKALIYTIAVGASLLLILCCAGCICCIFKCCCEKKAAPINVYMAAPQPAYSQQGSIGGNHQPAYYAQPPNYAQPTPPSSLPKESPKYT